MSFNRKLEISTPTSRQIRIERQFDAPPERVFDAHTKPELISQWMLGPEGWTMPICEVDLRVGGKYQYVWRHPDKPDMGLGGVFEEIVPARRIVNTEKFDTSWYPGEAIVTTEFAPHTDGTALSVTIEYESEEIRDGVLKSPMDEGMSAGYARLDELLIG